MSDDTPSAWSFYGRDRELSLLSAMVAPGRFFFVRVTGRRRIGKTTLVLRALRQAHHERIAYIRVPDSDPGGIVLAARDHLRRSGVPGSLPVDLRGLASLLGMLIADGWVVVLDEYQPFARKPMAFFNTMLQAEVDDLREPAREISGGLVLISPVQEDLGTLFDGRRAPLHGRDTAALHLDHLDLAAVAGIHRAHGVEGGARLLFWWTLLQGIPRYWRVAAEIGALRLDRQEALLRLFLDPDAPLAVEGAGGLAEELRGGCEPLLRFLARHPGSAQPEIQAGMGRMASYSEEQVGLWLSHLERRKVVARRNPAFVAGPRMRLSRYHLEDNFFAAWFGALSGPVAFVGVKDAAALAAEADQRLALMERATLKRFAARAWQEGGTPGGFSVSGLVWGLWDDAGSDIDLVAVDDVARRVRLGTCQRTGERLIGDLGGFDGQVERFMAAHPRFAGWEVERVGVAVELAEEHRTAIEAAGYVAQDVGDLVGGMGWATA